MKTFFILVLITNAATADYAQRRHKQAEHIAENVCTVHRYGGATNWQTSWVNQCEAGLSKCFPKIRPVLEVPQIKNKLVRKILGPVSPWVQEEWCRKSYITARQDDSENLNEGSEYNECISVITQKVDGLLRTVTNSASEIPFAPECDPYAVPTNSADSSGRGR